METSSSIYSPYPYKKKVQKKARNILYTSFFIIYKKKLQPHQKIKIYTYTIEFIKRKKKTFKSQNEAKKFCYITQSKKFQYMPNKTT